jgi:hypothetical protein
LSKAGNTVVKGSTIEISKQNTINQNIKGNEQYYNNNPNSIGGVINNSVDTVGDVGAAGLLGAGILGATAIGAVGSVAETVVDEASGLLKGAGSGVKDILTTNNRIYGKDNTTIAGPNGKPVTINRTEGAFKSPYGTSTVDQFSYYGSLPSKGDSNFMPLTADFSSFSR